MTAVRRTAVSLIASYSGADWSIERCALLINNNSHQILEASSLRSRIMATPAVRADRFFAAHVRFVRGTV